MALYENLKTVTMEVAAAIDANVCVVQSAARTVAAAGAAADPFGVTLESVTTDDFTNGKRTVAVALINGGGRVGIRSSAAIAANANVGCAASGEIRTAATSDVIIGKAEEAAGAADQVITINIDKKAELSA